MNKLLSIVIPTYNMEAYLNRCLDSLLVSEDTLSLLEVLIINDGSKDKSSEIAHEYETKYPNTFRIIDKENGNYGSCINRGLKYATGKYIKVLDADDWFDTKELEKYLLSLSSAEADLVLTDFNIVHADNLQSELAFHPNLQAKQVYSFKDCSITEVGIYTMHAVTYRTEFLRSINYVQTTGISYTDSEWVHKPLYAINTMVYLNYNVYQYLIGREGQTMDSKIMLKTIKHHEIVACSLVENEKLHPSFGFASILMQKQLLYLVSKIYRTLLVLQDSSLFKNDELRVFDLYIKKQLPMIYRRMNRLVLKKTLPIPYVLFWRMFNHRFPVDSIRQFYRRIKYGKERS